MHENHTPLREVLKQQQEENVAASEVGVYAATVTVPPHLRFLRSVKGCVYQDLCTKRKGHRTSILRTEEIHQH